MKNHKIIITHSELQYLRDVITQVNEGDTIEVAEAHRLIDGFLDTGQKEFEVVKLTLVEDNYR